MAHFTNTIFNAIKARLALLYAPLHSLSRHCMRALCTTLGRLTHSL